MYIYINVTKITHESYNAPPHPRQPTGVGPATALLQLHFIHNLFHQWPGVCPWGFKRFDVWDMDMEINRDKCLGRCVIYSRYFFSLIFLFSFSLSLCRSPWRNLSAQCNFCGAVSFQCIKLHEVVQRLSWTLAKHLGIIGKHHVIM